MYKRRPIGVQNTQDHKIGLFNVAAYDLL